MSVGARATWYKPFFALRAALERRGKWAASDELLWYVHRKISTTEGVIQRIEHVRVAEGIPREEVYEDDDEKVDATGTVPT